MIRSVRVLVGAVCLSLVVMFVEAPAGPAPDTAVRTTTSSVPAPVLGAFQDAYPEAEITGMASLTEGGKVHYEIESTDAEMSLKVLYLADGTLVAVEESVAEEDLPEPVTAAIEAKYPGSKIVKALRNTRDGATTYLLKVYSGGRRLTLVLKPDGTLKGAKDTGGNPGSPAK